VRWGLGRALLEDYGRSGDLATLEEAHEAFLGAQDMTSPPDGSDPDPALLVTPYDQLQASLGVAWYLLICARDAPDECTFEEAELVFEELVRRTAGSPYRLSHGRALTGLGIARSRVGRLDEAELSLEEATARAPELAEAWFALAEFERRRGDLSAAEAAYRSALERTPRDAEIQTALGDTLVAQGREAEGRALLEQAARAGAGAERWQAHVQLGVLAGQEGRFDEALAEFDRALALDPDAAPAHLNRGKALLQLGRTAEAAEAFGEACRTDPRSFEAHYNLGVLLLQTGQPAEARPHLRAALELEPDHEVADRIRDALQSGG
jgi:tetratricopeptide (TPR) repeat protein